MTKIDSSYNFLLHPLDKAQTNQRQKRAGKFVSSVVIGILSVGIAHYTVYKLHNRSIKLRYAGNLTPVEQITTNTAIDRNYWVDPGAYPYNVNNGKVMGPKEAKKYHQEYAAKGSPFAQYYVGYFAEFGIGGKVNLAQAREYYELAADKNPNARYKLAYFFEFGMGGEKNLEMAYTLYKQAAKEMNHSAQLRYAYFLQKGIGCQNDQIQEQANEVYQEWINSIDGINENWINQSDFFIPFNQKEEILLSLSTQKKQYPKLDRVNSKFKGLCELICNQILIQGLLREESPFFLMEGINLESLNQEPVVSSHTVDLHKKREVGEAFLFNQHPDNIFTIEEQKLLLVEDKKDKSSTLNTALIESKLSSMKTGETLKVHMFKKKNMINISGHTMLIHKIEDAKYIFFDPDVGEFGGISIESVLLHLEGVLEKSRFNAIFFTSGAAFLAKVQEQL